MSLTTCQRISTKRVPIDFKEINFALFLMQFSPLNAQWSTDRVCHTIYNRPRVSNLNGKILMDEHEKSEEIRTLYPIFSLMFKCCRFVVSTHSVNTSSIWYSIITKCAIDDRNVDVWWSLMPILNTHPEIRSISLEQQLLTSTVEIHSGGEHLLKAIKFNVCLKWTNLNWEYEA